METTVSGNVENLTGEIARQRILSRRFEPLFLADWDRVLLLHFEVDPNRLQAIVPFELDLFEGRRAFVSLVAFTMRQMRPRFGGMLAAWLMRPIATHPFFRVWHEAWEQTRASADIREMHRECGTCGWAGPIPFTV